MVQGRMRGEERRGGLREEPQQAVSEWRSIRFAWHVEWESPSGHMSLDACESQGIADNIHVYSAFIF